MDLTGRIKKLFDEQTFPSGFKKRELVITTSEQYPQDILVEFLGDNTSLLAPFKLGDEIKVDINIRGREWTNPEGQTKYFNSISGWRVIKLSAADSGKDDYAPIPPSYEDLSKDDSEIDDLPF